MAARVEDLKSLLLCLCIAGCSDDGSAYERGRNAGDPPSSPTLGGAGGSTSTDERLPSAEVPPTASAGGSAGNVASVQPMPIECDDPSIATGVSGLIDDLEDRNSAIFPLDGRRGNWYAYNDGSGTQSPPPYDSSMVPFPPTNEGHDPGNNGGYAAHTAGSGFTIWGAGIGFDLNNPSERACRYDARAYSGISFWVKGTGNMRLKLPTPATIPTSRGGRCVPGTNANDPAGLCDNAFGADIQFTNTWTEYSFAWDQLKQQAGWGQTAVFDPAELVQVQFEAPANQSFDFSVDDVQFF